MDSLEQAFEEIRAASVPKAKFTFKRRENKPPIPGAHMLLPASCSIDALGERDGEPDMSTFHKLTTLSHCRVSLQSMPALGVGSSSDLTISDLDHCIVDLCRTTETAPGQNQLSLTALHVRDLKETILILPNVKGSVLLYNLHRCTVIVTCHQASILLSDESPSLLLHVVPHAQLDQCSGVPRCHFQSNY